MTEEEIEELKAQIEKMKCCQNCKYYDEDNYCEMRRCIIHTLIGGCENWEIAK